jgi:hypothetical protein
MKTARRVLEKGNYQNTGTEFGTTFNFPY